MTFQLPEGFKPITLQIIFDAAWQAFIVERRPPAQVLQAASARGEPEYACRYRTIDGRSCAVGLPIPKGHPYENEIADFCDLLELEEYNLRHNDCGIEHTPAIFAKELIAMIDPSRGDAADLESDREFLNAFQSRLHDNLAEEGKWVITPEAMEREYRAVAADYGLTVPGDKSAFVEPNS